MSSSSDFRDGANGFEDALIDIRRVTLNCKAFSYIKSDNNIYIETKADVMMGQQLAFHPPNLAKPLTLDVLRVDKLSKKENIIIYSGKVKGDHYSSFIFSVDDEVIIGNVKQNGLIYHITPNDKLGGIITLSILDEAKIPKDPDDAVESEENLKFINIANKSGSSNGVVKTLYYYASNVTSGSSKAMTLNVNFNNVLSNSVVPSGNLLSYAGAVMVPSTFSTYCKLSILNQMKNASGVFSNIDSDLIAYGADIAVLILNGPAGKSCQSGYIGTVGGQALIDDSTNPFAVVADNYLTASADYTGVHEIGHIFGGRHSYIPVAGRRGITNVSDTSNKWQSMMGSYGVPNCEFTGLSSTTCTRIPYFSNPDLSYNSNPLGESTRNMKNHLKVKMPSVSNWRGNPVPPPNAPTGIAAISDQCYGSYNIDWDNMSGATSYQLDKSLSPSFTNPVQIYSGTITDTWVNVNSGTWYFRAKACNAGGCSSYSSQSSATRLTYCQ